MSELLKPDTRRILDKYNSNIMWYRNNYQTLKQKYTGQIIFIIDENNVENYKDINAVQKRLERGDIDRQTVVIDYISESDTPIIV